MKKRVLLGCLIVGGVAGVGIALVALDSDTRRHGELTAANSEFGTDATTLEVPDESLTVEELLRQELTHAATGAERVEALERYAAKPGASSDSNVLRSRMTTDASPQVRLRAFQVAKELAVSEDRNAVISILKAGIGNPYPEVRRESIRACRDHPNYELLEDLIEIVDRGGADRSVAIQALAFMDDPEAQQKVLDTAMSEELPRPDRVQAIALLARTDLNQGVSYLQELATGDDPELQRYAMEALKIWQDRKANK